MIRVLIIISFFTFPAYLRAATINVISGEHADFSRLVFQYPDAEEWNISRFDEGYILETASGSHDYNMTKIFNFIPKTRIVKLEPGPDGTLKIFTKPGFHLDAFDLRAGRLVVDIKDGPASVGSKFELPVEQAQTDTRVEDESAAVTALLTANTTLPNLRMFNEMANGALTSTLPNLVNTYISQPIENEYFSPNLDPLGQQSLRVREMEGALFGQISRAVSQGLLKADLPDKEKVVEATNRLHNTPTPVVEPQAPTLPLKPEIKDKMHVRVRTAIDRDQKLSTSSQADMIEFSCPPENELAIETWGEPPQDGLMLSEFRSLVLGEFDQSLTKGVEKLAKYYLYLSFGAEAKMVLDEFGVFASNAQFLRLIADVMDEGHSTSYGLLSQFSQCPGATAFWAIAAREDLSRENAIPSKQVASYFSGLPLHLRQHLGPTLSERFLAIGDVKSAKIIQNALSRVEAIHGDAFDLLSAEMQLADGDIDQAILTLTDISKEDGPSATEALIRSIDLLAEQNRSIDQKTAELAEVLMIEHRGTPLEGALARASIVARIFSGDPDVALQALARPNTQNLLTSIDLAKLINVAATKFTSDFDDLAFAREALSLADNGANQLLTDETKSQIARRMLSIGFADLASRFAVFDDDLTDSERMILGQIAMQNGNQTDAITYLIGIEGQEAALMRAELYLGLEMPKMAAEEFELADQRIAADDANFLAEDWERLSSSEDKKFATAADHFIDETPLPALENRITISAAQVLLDRSQTSRAIFDDLVQQ